MSQFVDRDESEPAGTKYRIFHSEVVHGDVSYLIYLPPDYDTSPEKRFPAVYWLHGLNDNQRAGASFVAQLDAAIREGKCPALIAVLVNGLVDSRYYDSYDGQRPVESVIVRDLIPHIDQTYRTLALRKTRALEGFSMGGFGSAHLGFKYPELFGAISILCGALLDDECVRGAPDVVATPALFEKNFGGSMAYFHAGSPWVLVQENAHRIRNSMAIRIGAAQLDRLLERSIRFHDLLDSLQIEHEFYTVPSVAHEQDKFYEARGTAGFEFYKRAFD